MGSHTFRILGVSKFWQVDNYKDFGYCLRVKGKVLYILFTKCINLFQDDLTKQVYKLDA